MTTGALSPSATIARQWHAMVLLNHGPSEPRFPAALVLLALPRRSPEPLELDHTIDLDQAAPHAFTRVLHQAHTVPERAQGRLTEANIDHEALREPVSGCGRCARTVRHVD